LKRRPAELRRSWASDPPTGKTIFEERKNHEETTDDRWDDVGGGAGAGMGGGAGRRFGQSRAEGVVSFTLAADKTVFVAKDPLEFKLTVTNVSRQAYTFTTGRAHYYWKYHIKSADRDAEYEVCCAMLFEAEPAPFSARLAPGETAVQPITLGIFTQGDVLGFRLLKGAPSDTGKRNESLESARLPAGRYAMTVEFDYRLVSEESVAGKATLGPVAFTLAGELETEAQRQARQAAEAMAQIERKPQIDRERELKERAIRERGP
jgi:hypothetical protein